jgi:hypothetical protein
MPTSTSRARSAVRIATRLVIGLVVLLMTAWGAAALSYADLGSARVATALALAFAIGVGAVFILLPGRWALAAFVVLFGTLVLWWLQIPASNDRDWQTEVKVTPYATVAGDLVTIHGVRNFEYRTEIDFIPRWETRTYDLRNLDSVDLVAVYWAGKAIAHIMVSFGFGGRDFVTMSIETRKERSESYSALAGFFKQYELVYVVGDERDLIGVRTTHRQPQEDVYVYRVRAPRVNIRRSFLDYVKTMNDMREYPQFYNTLTTNCTTGVRMHSRVNPEAPPWSWKIMLSGYVPDRLYELDRLDTSRPFPELERLSRVNPRAHAAGQDPAFSQRIREGLPIPSPWGASTMAR